MAAINLRSQSDFGVPGVNTVFFGANSIRYFGSVIWNSLPNDLKTFVILIYLKRQYGDGNQLTVLVGCVKTTLAALVSLLFQINYTRQFMQVFFIMFCKNKISLIVIIV